MEPGNKRCCRGGILKPGDRVKFSAEGLRLFIRVVKGRKPCDKRGSVKAIGRDSEIVRVQWDDRISLDSLHEHFLELDSQGSPPPQPASTREQRFTNKDS